MPRDRVVDTYFLEHRAKLIDIAAFLDRVDRASAPTPGGISKTTIDADLTHGRESRGPAEGDDRVVALTRALGVLCDGQPNRAARVLALFSDPTVDPIDTPTSKGATGAYAGGHGGDQGQTSGDAGGS